MKKFLSIVFALLILLSGMHFTVATHYCGGFSAFTKLSVSGELATCGMEGTVDNCSSPVKLNGANCCKDKVAALVVDPNYSTSFAQLKHFAQHLQQVYQLPITLLNKPQPALLLICSNASPPGNFLVSDVSLPTICVFRI